jgi:hypothetical protein
MNFSLFLLISLATIFSAVNSVKKPQPRLRLYDGKTKRRLIDFHSDMETDVEADINVNIDGIKDITQPNRLKQIHSLLNPNRHNRLREKFMQERLENKSSRKQAKKNLFGSPFNSRHLLQKNAINPMEKPDLPEGPLPEQPKPNYKESQPNDKSYQPPKTEGRQEFKAKEVTEQKYYQQDKEETEEKYYQKDKETKEYGYEEYEKKKLEKEELESDYEANPNEKKELEKDELEHDYEKKSK